MGKTIYDESYRGLIARLRDARKSLNLTQTEAGKLVNKSRSWLGKIETCELRLDVLYYVRLCRALNLEPGRQIRQLR